MIAVIWKLKRGLILLTVENLTEKKLTSAYQNLNNYRHQNQLDQLLEDIAMAKSAMTYDRGYTEKAARPDQGLNYPASGDQSVYMKDEENDYPMKYANENKIGRKFTRGI